MLAPETFPEFFVPDRAFIEGLRVGDLAPNCFGQPARVVEIFGRAVSVQGRAFVCYYTEFGSSSTISNSLVEGELHRSTRISGRHTSHELDTIEARIVAERTER